MNTLLVTVALLATAPAHACSCWVGLGQTAPHDGATAVPTNSQVVMEFYWQEEGEYELFDVTTDELVPSTRTVRDESGQVQVVLVPDSPLAPSTTYELRPDVDDEGYSEYAPVSSFTTGDSADDTAPDAPAITDAYAAMQRRSNSSCGNSAQNIWEFGAVNEPVLYEVEVARSDDFSNSRLFLSHDEVFSAGWGGCSSTWPELEFSDNLFARVRAVDHAGNVSAWSDAERATGNAMTGGCSHTGGGFGSVFGLAGLLLLTRRGR